MARDEFRAEDYKCLETIGEVAGEKTLLRVAIWRYKAGEPKLKVQRIGRKKDESEYVVDPAGMSAEEAEGVGGLLVKGAAALRKMK